MTSEPFNVRVTACRDMYGLGGIECSAVGLAPWRYSSVGVFEVGDIREEIERQARLRSRGALLGRRVDITFTREAARRVGVK